MNPEIVSSAKTPPNSISTEGRVSISAEALLKLNTDPARLPPSSQSNRIQVQLLLSDKELNLRYRAPDGTSHTLNIPISKTERALIAHVLVGAQKSNTPLTVELNTHTKPTTFSILTEPTQRSLHQPVIKSDVTLPPSFSEKLSQTVSMSALKESREGMMLSIPMQDVQLSAITKRPLLSVNASQAASIAMYIPQQDRVVKATVNMLLQIKTEHTIPKVSAQSANHQAILLALNTNQQNLTATLPLSLPKSPATSEHNQVATGQFSVPLTQPIAKALLTLLFYQLPTTKQQIALSQLPKTLVAAIKQTVASSLPGSVDFESGAKVNIKPNPAIQSISQLSEMKWQINAHPQQAPSKITLKVHQDSSKPHFSHNRIEGISTPTQNVLLPILKPKTPLQIETIHSFLQRPVVHPPLQKLLNVNNNTQITNPLSPPSVADLAVLLNPSTSNQHLVQHLVQSMIPPMSTMNSVPTNGLMLGLTTLVQVALQKHLSQVFTDRPIPSVIAKIVQSSTKGDSPNSTTRLHNSSLSAKEILDTVSTILRPNQQAALSQPDRPLQSADGMLFLLPNFLAPNRPNIELRIKEESFRAPNSSRLQKRWRLEMRFDMGEIGSMLSRARLMDKTVNLDMYADNEKLVERIKQHIPILQSVLSQSDIELSTPHIYTGKIPSSLVSIQSEIFNDSISTQV